MHRYAPLSIIFPYQYPFHLGLHDSVSTLIAAVAVDSPAGKAGSCQAAMPADISNGRFLLP